VTNSANDREEGSSAKVQVRYTRVSGKVLEGGETGKRRGARPSLQEASED